MSYGELLADKHTALLLLCNKLSGGSTPDSSGQSNSGTVSGVSLTTGRFGNGLSFSEGSSDAITCGTSGFSTAQGTLEFFLKPGNFGGTYDRRWLCYMYNASPLTRLYIDTYNTTWRFQLGSDSLYSSSAPFESGSWQHLVIAWNLTGYKLYWNGDQTDERAFSGFGQFSSAIKFGRDNGACLGFLLDMLRMSTVQRSAKEIRQTYTMMQGALSHVY